MQYTIIIPPQPKSVGNYFLDISKAFLRLRPWASLGVPRLQRIMQNIMQYTIIHTPQPKSVGNHFLAISKAFPRLRPWASLGVPGRPYVPASLRKVRAEEGRRDMTPPPTYSYHQDARQPRQPQLVGHCSA